MYADSQLVSESFRKTLISQSFQLLAEATFELSLTMESDINHLINRGKHTKSKGVAYIDEHMQSINQCFAFIHQAFLLRAGIYCNENELNAMVSVFSEYSNFIENTVEKNIILLSQCDVNDDGTEQGIWKSRVRLKSNLTDFSKQLNSSEKVIYLGMCREVNNG